MLTVLYDAGCGLCTASMRWAHRHDRRGRIDWRPIADAVEVRGHRFGRDALDREMHAVDEAGRVYRGFTAWRRIAREIPLLMPLWPLLWIPPVPVVGRHAYRWIAAHRRTLSCAVR
jgi:predicted DCC family thiol-disulfide oxidoreductase YuxK